MKTRPILFNGDMVRAILDGRKTQTRRPVMPQPFMGDKGWFDADLANHIKRVEFSADGGTWWWLANYTHDDDRGYSQGGYDAKCPYGVPGDELWVRETFNTMSAHWCDVLRSGTADPEEMTQARKFACDYRADRADKPYPFKWTPSIHMPRWASRLTLRVTDVRVQRVKDITEDDARAEGAQRFDAIPVGRLGSPARWSMGTPTTTDQCLGTPRFAFGNAWEKAYGQAAWDSNPYVWAISFEVCP